MGVRIFGRLLALLLTTLAATLGLVFSATGPAAACSCVEGGLAHFAESADTVFTGEVAEVDRGEQTVVYTFDVERIYDGRARDEVRVETGSQDSACGLPGLEPGRRYAVYAHTGDGGVLSTGLCSGTQAAGAGYVDRLEAHLGAGRPPAPARPPGADPSDGGVPTWMIVAIGAAGVLIGGGLVGGAIRVRRSGGASVS